MTETFEQQVLRIANKHFIELNNLTKHQIISNARALAAEWFSPKNQVLISNGNRIVVAYRKPEGIE